MDRKPTIEYVGQYYVFGSEARQVEIAPKKPRTVLPRLRLNQLQKLYVDPMALLGLTVAVVMLVVLAVGAVKLYGTIGEYRQLNSYVSQLRRENASLQHAYHTAFDLDAVRQAAENAGLIEASEAERWIIRVTVPEHPAQPTFWENARWFWKTMFSGARR